ncbi:MAG: aminopeptidase P family protein [Candidatus Thermoplasmatota archaeon]|nr:aminopeptidase P family protein [Candidatus Thermoplasmatota archaeon]
MKKLIFTERAIEKSVYEKRLARIQERLEEQGSQAFIIKNEGNIRYLCCSHLPYPVVSYLVITEKDSPIGIAASLEELRARDQSSVKELFSFADHPGIKADGKKAEEVLKKVLAERKISNALVDTKMAVKGVRTKTDNFISKLREKKDVQELENIKKACRLASRACKKLEDFVEDGRTELQIANELDYYVRSLGAQANSFPTIIASGKHSCYSHHHPTNKKIKCNESVVCDFGAMYKGYCSDITRTVFVGNPPKELLKVYELVREAQLRAIKMTKPGVRFRDIDLSIRNFFKEHNYDRYFVHSAGHGIGLEVHEAPKVSCTNKNKIFQGNVFTLEPGLYIPKKFGVRIEDVVVVEKSGARILTRL